MSDSASSTDSSESDSSASSDSSSYDSYLSDSSSTDSSEADSSASERQPSSKRLKASDRISGLPDAVLHQILCFRDMKEVVQTSRLSRRWRSVWKSVPTLNFIFPTNTRKTLYPFEMRFVDRVFLLRNDDVNIEKLVFSCNDTDNDDLDNWITVAEKRNVQQLCLDLEPNSRRGMRFVPSFIFSSNIKVFKLQGKNEFVRVPKSICFAPNLQTIELLSVVLPTCNSKNDVEISCAVLEKLRLSKCNHYRIETLHISAPQLKDLVLEDPVFPDRKFCCKLKLSTPNLTSLILKGRFYRNYSLGTLPSLINAKFESDGEVVGAAIFNNVLNALCNVRHLQVSNLILKPESAAKLDQLHNPFLNLRHLGVIGCSDGSLVRPIYGLLKNALLLENLALGINQIKMDNDWIDLFQCVSHLKSIEINDIEGREIELDFFKFVLEAAVSLEVFNVTPNEKFLVKSKKEKANFTMKMHSLPRASSMVQVLFFQ